MDKILQVKNNKELVDFLEGEKEDAEIYRLKRSGTPMSKVVLAHNWGIGDCPGCSVCGI